MLMPFRPEQLTPEALQKCTDDEIDWLLVETSEYEEIGGGPDYNKVWTELDRRRRAGIWHPTVFVDPAEIPGRLH
jgi:hypothetical protein